MSGAPPPAARRVVLFGLGGTIAMGGGAGGGVVPTLSADQVVAAVPRLAETGVHLDVVDFRRLPGAWVTFDDLAALGEAIAGQFAAGADGVVVTQGTDTIEESAYVLDLGHAGAAPIVVTGAMRNPTLAGPDGPANLLAAIQVAASAHCRDQGCLVVMADEIHAARRVRKAHTSSTAAFGSPDGGPLGYVVEGVPRLLSRLPHRFTVPPFHGGRPPRVGLVTVTLDDDGEALQGLDGRVDGLVIAAFGAGHVPDGIVETLAGLAEALPVVLASRTGAGPVLANTYAFAGSESDLIRLGLISSGFLDPYKARILLRAALAVDADRDAIATAFAAAGGYAAPATWPWR